MYQCCLGIFLCFHLVVLVWSVDYIFLMGIEGACPAILVNPCHCLLIGEGVLQMKYIYNDQSA